MTTRTRLRAGPLTLELGDEGDLRYVCLGRREVLRRVYVAVRDHEWGTVPARVSDLRVEAGDDAFRVSLACTHQRDGIGFSWRGTFVGDADGTIRYDMQGEADTTFLRNRIGICVLHPGAEAAGARFRVTHTDGQPEEGTLPTAIDPHQPVVDIRELAHEVLPGLWAALAFEGEVFEMEDQRNWTDASFKTYSTPLALPKPVEIAAGTRVAQTITLTLSGSVPRPTPPDRAITITIDDLARGILPAIGLGLGAPLDGQAIDALRAAAPAHLRVELRLGEDGWETALRRADQEARALGAALEIAVVLPSEASGGLRALRRLVDELRPDVARWLLFGAADPATTADAVALAREQLGDYAAGVPIGGGSNTNFTELNRNRDGVSALDLVAYPINPQVHAFDDASMVETLVGQQWTVESARAFAGDRPIAVTPVTLRPHDRWDPRDSRQGAPFTAAWTLASIKHLAEAGVTSATYFETAGPLGVLGTPTLGVLTALADQGGARVVPSRSTHPLLVESLVLDRGGRRTAFLVNLTGEPRQVRFGLTEMDLQPYAIVRQEPV